MKRLTSFVAAMALLPALSLAVLTTQPTTRPTILATTRPTTQPMAQSAAIEVTVDPRVELMSVIFFLAGSPEYSQPKVKSYADDVSKYFDSFLDQDAVKMARELRVKSGISFDAPMSLAVHLSDIGTMGGVMPLDPRPEGVDARWKQPELLSFLDAARRFVADTNFMNFYEAHRGLYAIAIERMTEALNRDARLSWFNDFFGARPGATFHLILAPLNGGQCYGPHVHYDSGDELYCILGIWNTDAKGEPTFPRSVMPFVVHEFCHSYVNPLVDAHFSELKIAGEKLFEKKRTIMRKQAYSTPLIVLRESLVRACVVRYRNDVEGEDAAKAEIAQQERLGFAWMKGLSDLLGQYESHRDQYKTLDDFMPRIVKYFNDVTSK